MTQHWWKPKLERQHCKIFLYQNQISIFFFKHQILTAWNVLPSTLQKNTVLNVFFLIRYRFSLTTTLLTNLYGYNHVITRLCKSSISHVKYLRKLQRKCLTCGLTTYESSTSNYTHKIVIFEDSPNLWQIWQVGTARNSTCLGNNVTELSKIVYRVENCQDTQYWAWLSSFQASPCM